MIKQYKLITGKTKVFKYVRLAFIISLISLAVSNPFSPKKSLAQQLLEAWHPLVHTHDELSEESRREQREKIQKYRNILRKNPNDKRAHMQLGRAYGTMKSHLAAMQEYRRALEIDPDYAWAHNNLGYELRRVGRYAEATAFLERALDLDPEYSTAYYNLGNVYVHQHKYSEAIPLLEKAIEINSNESDYHHMMSIAYARVGRFEESFREAKIVLAMTPKSASAHYTLACHHALLGELDESLEYLSKTLELDEQYLELVIYDGDFDSIENEVEFIAFIDSYRAL